MLPTKDRIKKIRKSAGLTQTAFGELIGAKGNTVTGWETGLRVPSDAIVKSICREFAIREEWLRTGEEPMNIPTSRDEEISNFVAKVMDGESDDFRKRLLTVLSKLSVDEWKLLESMAIKLANESKKEDQAEA